MWVPQKYELRVSFNKNAKIKTLIYNFSLMINNNGIITFYKNFNRVTIHHGWKAEKLYCDVKKEMENEKEIDW